MKILFAEIILSNITPFIPTSYQLIHNKEIFSFSYDNFSIIQTLWHQDATVTLKQTEHDPVLTICNTSPKFGPVLSPFSVFKSCFLTYTQTLQITSIIKHLVQPEQPKQPWASLLHCLSTWPYGFSEMLNNTPVPFAFNSSPGVSYLWICLSSLATQEV